jgi:hypothetical protein
LCSYITLEAGLGLCFAFVLHSVIVREPVCDATPEKYICWYVSVDKPVEIAVRPLCQDTQFPATPRPDLHLHLVVCHSSTTIVSLHLVFLLQSPPVNERVRLSRRRRKLEPRLVTVQIQACRIEFRMVNHFALG